MSVYTLSTAILGSSDQQIEIVLSIIITLVFLGITFRSLLSAFHEYNTGRAIRENEPIPIADLTAASSPLEFEGVAQPTAENPPFSAPLSGIDSLLCKVRFQVEEMRSNRHGYKTKNVELNTQPFLVTDERRQVVVDPADAAVHLGGYQTTEKEGMVRKKRKQEKRLEPGDTVHVYGATITDEATEFGSETVGTVGACEETIEYQITKGSEENAVSSQNTQLLVSLFVATVTGAATLYLLYGLLLDLELVTSIL